MSADKGSLEWNTSGDSLWNGIQGDSIGYGKTSKPIIAYFESKVDRDDDECFQDLESFKNGDTTIIVADNKKADQVNRKKLEELLPEEENIVFRAEDKIKNVDQLSPRLEDVPYTKTGGLRTILSLKRNSPVLITMNLDKSDYLTNGQRRYVVEVDVTNSIVWVAFSEEKVGLKKRRKSQLKLEGHPNAVPIHREKATFSWGCKGSVICIVRTQFPMVMSFGLTSHKCQGMTISKVLVDFTDMEGTPVSVPPGSFYVAITRVRTGKDLYLTHFSPAFIKSHKSVEEEMARMTKHCKYEFHKKYLHENIFIGCSGENVEDTKISYLNVNGLLNNEHIVDLKHDKNLLNSDFICVSEAKLNDSVLEESITIPSFNIISHLTSCSSRSRACYFMGEKEVIIWYLTLWK